MFTEDFDSLEMKILKSTQKRKQDEKNCKQGGYHQPEVYLLGSLEHIQAGGGGTAYDGYTNYWYYD
ncbi:MAG: hypothetical protein WBM44_25070 [Waterburya sp.]